MLRVRFRKGFQRKFIQKVLVRIGCPCLRELINRGINVNYSTLKNYYCEARLLPENLFFELCEISGLNSNDFKVDFVEENWGRIIGGKKSRRS